MIIINNSDALTQRSVFVSSVLLLLQNPKRLERKQVSEHQTCVFRS